MLVRWLLKGARNHIKGLQDCLDDVLFVGHPSDLFDHEAQQIEVNIRICRLLIRREKRLRRFESLQ